jgi:hypothetical protein
MLFLNLGAILSFKEGNPKSDFVINNVVLLVE